MTFRLPVALRMAILSAWLALPTAILAQEDRGAPDVNAFPGRAETAPGVDAFPDAKEAPARPRIVATLPEALPDEAQKAPARPAGGVLTPLELDQAIGDVAEARGAATVEPFSGINFLVAMLAGLLLALGFQVLLTHLSVATGVSMLGPLDEDNRSGNDRDRVSLGEQARTVTTAFGLWSIVTTCLSLFFACWLAIELSRSFSLVLGAILGLVIWALFYLTLLSVEAAALSSLVGGLTRMALGGLQSLYQSTAALLAPSAGKKAADVASEVTEAITRELADDLESGRLRKAISACVQGAEARPVDPGRVRRDLARLLDETDLRALASRQNGPLIDPEQVVVVLRDRAGLGEETAQAVVRSLESSLSRLIGGVDDGGERQGAGRPGRDLEQLRTRLESYLRDTDKEELNPEGIRRDLELLITQPRAGAAALRDRLAAVDRSTVAALLAERGDLTTDEANRIIAQVEESARALGNELAEVSQQAEGALDEVLGRAQGKLRNYLDSLGQPQLDYEVIREEFQLLLQDPQAGIEALYDRARSLDRETLEAVIASTRSDLSEEDAEHLLDELEAARDEAIARLRRLRGRARRKIKALKEDTLDAAEEVRQVAASTAWWAFGTAAASAVAAALGGAVGAATDYLNI